jgi:hypothetical protein
LLELAGATLRHRPRRVRQCLVEHVEIADEHDVLPIRCRRGPALTTTTKTTTRPPPAAFIVVVCHGGTIVVLALRGSHHSAIAAPCVAGECPRTAHCHRADGCLWIRWTSPHQGTGSARKQSPSTCLAKQGETGGGSGASLPPQPNIGAIEEARRSRGEAFPRAGLSHCEPRVQPILSIFRMLEKG